VIAKKIAKTSAGRGSFGSLTEYIEEREEINVETGEVEMVTLSDDLVLTNCLSRETAAAEMQAVADQNGRVKDPVYHAVISWREDEEPTREQMFEAAAYTQAKLGMEGHQFVYAIHKDTGNYHIHLAINRVNPETEKAVDIRGDHFTLMEAMRELELKQGWEVVKEGCFKVVENESGKKSVQRLSKQENAQRLQERNDTRSQVQKDIEAHTGKESLLTYAQGDPKKDVLKVLKDPAANWQEVHSALTKHGLEIKPYGQGLVIAEKRENGFNVSASSVHENLSLSRLTKKLGKYQAPILAIKAEPPARKYSPHRDLNKRAEKREERALARAKLKVDYNTYRASVKPSKQSLELARASARVRYKAIGDKAARERKAVTAAKLSPAEKRAFRSVIAFETAKVKAALQAELKAERAARKPDAMKAWAAKQAENGNQAAMAYLRGQQYAEKRNESALRSSLADKDFISDAEKRDREPLAPRRNAFENIQSKVNKSTGEVSYRRDGQEIFRDTGDTITISAGAMQDAGNMEAALRLAAEKFGQNGIVLNGSDAFKAKAMQVILDKGIDVKFRDKDQAAKFEAMKQKRQADREKQQELARSMAAIKALSDPVKAQERQRDGTKEKSQEVTHESKGRGNAR
jgi:hypothetical protein